MKKALLLEKISFVDNKIIHALNPEIESLNLYY